MNWENRKFDSWNKSEKIGGFSRKIENRLGINGVALDVWLIDSHVQRTMSTQTEETYKAIQLFLAELIKEPSAT